MLAAQRLVAVLLVEQLQPGCSTFKRRKPVYHRQQGKEMYHSWRMCNLG